jgi:hypothetical protein
MGAAYPQWKPDPLTQALNDALADGCVANCRGNTEKIDMGRAGKHPKALA